MIRINLGTKFIVTVLFLETLRSIYFYNYGFSFDNIVILLIPIIWLVNSKPLNNHTLTIIGLTSISVAWGCLIALGKDSRFDTAIAILAWSIICAPFGKFFITDNSKKQLISALNIIVLAHAFFLLVQFLSQIILNQKIDYIYPLTGELSRLDGGAADNFGLGYFFRPSGFYNEPGTYASYMIPIVYLLMLLKKYEFNLAIIIGILSITLTFSTQGLIVIFLVVVYAVFKNITKLKLLWAFMLIAPLAYGLFYSAWDRYIARWGEGDASLNARTESIYVTFDTFIGNGFIAPQIAVADITSFLYWWWYTGILCIPFFLYLFYLARNNTDIIIFGLLIFISKIPASAPLYWTLVYILISLADSHRKCKNFP